MSLFFAHKDITLVNYGIIGHGVNTKGVMGSGVALAIRKKWEQVFTEYKQLWNTSNIRPSDDLLGLAQIVDISDEIKVANLFTQVNYGNDGARYASVDAIKESLEGLFDYAEFVNLPIFLPKIGGKLGGLDFEKEVQPIIEELAEEHPSIDVTICLF